MIFEELNLSGSYLICPEKHVDERGFFARSFCKSEFASKNLNTEFPQCNLSYNLKKGTLRGMHYQEAPWEEVKVVSCLRGAIYDVLLDIRETSPTYGKWIGVELNQDNCKMLYIPKGFAHGFQSLEDNSLVYYQMGTRYHSESSRGIHWNDNRFKIKWPLEEKIISEKDRSY